jgi:preprotein translocase SecE subunit
MSEVKKVIKEKKQSRLASVFTKEYKHEGLILLFLAIVAIVLGVLTITNELSFEGVYLIGDYPKAFGWILVLLGVFSFILAVWPFYKPSIDEVKRVSFPSKGIVLKDSVTVIMFSLIMALFFALADSGLKVITDWLSK